MTPCCRRYRRRLSSVGDDEIPEANEQWLSSWDEPDCALLRYPRGVPDMITQWSTNPRANAPPSRNIYLSKLEGLAHISRDRKRGLVHAKLIPDKCDSEARQPDCLSSPDGTE
jgi:hypothetical protein